MIKRASPRFAGVDWYRAENTTTASQYSWLIEFFALCWISNHTGRAALLAQLIIPVHHTLDNAATARRPHSLTCCIFFQREMPSELLITLKPFSAAYNAVRSKRMSKHMVQRILSQAPIPFLWHRSNQLSVS